MRPSDSLDGILCVCDAGWLVLYSGHILEKLRGYHFMSLRSYPKLPA